MTEAINNPDLVAARAQDDAWKAEQAEKRERASAAYALWRERCGLPMERKGQGEKF
jgi:hypothetical protein